MILKLIADFMNSPALSDDNKLVLYCYSIIEPIIL